MVDIYIAINLLIVNKKDSKFWRK